MDDEGPPFNFLLPIVYWSSIDTAVFSICRYAFRSCRINAIKIFTTAVRSELDGFAKQRLILSDILYAWVHKYFYLTLDIPLFQGKWFNVVLIYIIIPRSLLFGKSQRDFAVTVSRSLSPRMLSAPGPHPTAEFLQVFLLFVLSLNMVLQDAIESVVTCPKLFLLIINTLSLWL